MRRIERQRTLLLALLLLFGAAASPARAQDPCEIPELSSGESAAADFFDFLVDGCFGESACFGFAGESSICNRIAAWEQCWDPAAACEPEICGAAVCTRRQELTRLQVQEELIRRSAPLFAELRRLAAGLPESPWSDSLSAQLRAWEAPLATGDPAELPTAQWQPDGLTLFADDPGDVGGPPGGREIDTAEVLVDRCKAGAAACRAAFEEQGAIWTLAQLQLRMLRAVQRDNRLATERYLRGLDQRWRSYLLGGRSLFPWERLANGEIHRRRLATERGFVEPPSRQLLFLHPEAAYEYREWAEDGLDEVLLVEAVGFYRWSWGEGGEMKRPWGGSLILSWDGSDQDAVGYGLMIHLPRNWSLGAVLRKNGDDDEVAVLLAADLPKLFVKTSKLRDKLQDIRLGVD